jgi:urea transport system permease protein
LKNLSRSSYILLFIFLLSSPLFLHEFRVGLLAKFLCFAILAVGICLIWGYTGILSLGHGVFFGLGAYCMAMYLKVESSPSGIPDFMEWNGVTELPLLWKAFSNPFFAIGAAVIVPVLLAAILGYFTFKNRIRGVYFSLISQALVVVFVTLFIGKQEITGGSSGLTNFSTIFGIPLMDQQVQQFLYYLTVGFLLLTVVFALWLTKSRAGKVLIAIRDGENRVRFLGYDPTAYKVFIYCASAALAGLAGVLFVLQVGMISPAMMGIVPSIEMVLWVAVGGRHSIIGAIIGALLINSAKSFFSEAYPDIWQLFLGALFILVVLVMPNGIVGMIQSLYEKITSQRKKTGKGADQHETDTIVS